MKTLLLAPDTQLIQEFKYGNNKALEILAWRYKEKIFSSILFLVKDKYLAEDLFQDTFIKIIDTIRNDNYTEEGKFLSYAIRIAHNLCVDHFRKVKRVQIVNTGDQNEYFEIFNSSEDAVDKNIIRVQTSDLVRQLLDMLPEDQREVIVLRHFADLSFKEIAEMTNCSINTALGRMRYALTNMRRILAEKQVAL
ncbi:RNA polymerase sigma factor [Segetibacter koreensis]|uniref:RNA polymerase sigma factor n=1 Tax=Segetibacter koreensis TaxID=398037 RepID=UPI000369B3E5|nr:sigma-70 family RNA polymerase sigma factor [Segetibacter koreensis]